MILDLSAVLVGLSMSAQEDSGVIIMRHDIGPRYSQTDYESSCGSTVSAFVFEMGPGNAVASITSWSPAGPCLAQPRLCRSGLRSGELMVSKS